MADTPTLPLGRGDFERLVKELKSALVEAVSVPLLLDGTAARKYVGLSKSGWHRAKSAGKLPTSVYVEGSGERWRKKDLDVWIEQQRPRRGKRRRDTA
jgi:predicted DNA-binding transcriptional regulator AlpA